MNGKGETLFPFKQHTAKANPEISDPIGKTMAQSCAPDLAICFLCLRGRTAASTPHGGTAGMHSVLSPRPDYST